MPKAEFARINAEREELGLAAVRQPPQQRRRLAPPEGPARSPRAASSRPGSTSSSRTRRAVDSQSAALARLEALGFPVNPEREPGLDIEGVIAFTERWREARHELPYETDGVVRQGRPVRPAAAARDGEPRAALGDRVQVPAGAGRDASSRTSSRTSGGPGRSRPVAHLRAGEGRGLHGRPGHAPQPRRGPAQGHPDRRHGRAPEGGRRDPRGRAADPRQAARRRPRVRGARRVPGVRHARRPDEGAVRHYCPNPVCPARLSQAYQHFVGRGGMDIEGAGWAVLTQLLERGMVHTPGGLLPAHASRTSSRSSGSRARAPRTCTPRSSGRGPGGRSAKVLNSLGIPQVGESTAVDLARWLARRVRPDAYGPAARIPRPASTSTRGSPPSRRSCGGSRSTSPRRSRRSRASARRCPRRCTAGSPTRRPRDALARAGRGGRGARSVPWCATRARRTRTGRSRARRSS